MGTWKHCHELRAFSASQVVMFQALSEQKAEKSSSPESCQHSDRNFYEAHDPIVFFFGKGYNLKRPLSQFANVERSISSFLACFASQDLASFCEQIFFLTLRTPRYHGYHGYHGFLYGYIVLCLPRPATVVILHFFHLHRPLV